MCRSSIPTFYFFHTFLLLPAWYGIITKLLKAFTVKDEAIGAVPRTSAEREKAEKLKSENKGLKLVQSRAFVVNLGITVVLTIIFLTLLWSVSTHGEVNSFDPFQILEVESGADAKAIKKAYRKMSLQYHPDKNPGDRAAEAKFMMITKAYEALTDETAKENWEKYGNPDGKQSLEVGLGLPSFLLDSSYRNLVLVSYLFIMVGLVPYCVWTYYSNSSKYGEKDVMYDTYSWYHHALSEHAIVKQLPEALAGSAEFRKRNLPKSIEDKQAIGNLTAKLRTSINKPKYTHPVCLKGNVLLHAHLLRKTDLLNEQQMDDLKYMLRMSSPLIDAMISVCKHQDWMQTAMNCIEFGQYVAQAMWVKDSPLLQLPHFTEEEAKHCKTGKSAVKSVQEYRDMDEDDRKGMVNFTETQKKDVRDFLKIFPDVTIETKIFTDDDEDPQIYENDLVTLQVSITRNNVEKGEKVGLVHAPLFPFPKKEAWWVILGQLKQGKIISIEKVTNPNHKVDHLIKFMAPPQGVYVFDLVVKSNAYVGCDYQTKVEMECLDNSALPGYKVHPEDAELDDEPTLWEEMLNQNIEQDSDDEDEDEEDSDEEEEDAGAGAMTAAEKKKAKLRQARQQDDDSDDDSDED